MGISQKDFDLGDVSGVSFWLQFSADVAEGDGVNARSGASARKVLCIHTNYTGADDPLIKGL